jgi:hypothetical protein
MTIQNHREQPSKSAKAHPNRCLAPLRRKWLRTDAMLNFHAAVAAGRNSHVIAPAKKIW